MSKNKFKKFDGVDVIAVMQRGRIPAIEKYYSLNKEFNTRLLSFYPRTISNKVFESFMKKDNNNYHLTRLRNKYDSFQKGVHLHLSEFVKEFSEDKVHDSEPEEIFELINKIKKISPGEQFPNISFEEFVYNPKLRLSESPNEKNIAYLVDDNIHEKNTLRYSIYEMFKLGYEKVIFYSKISEYNDNCFSGDLNAFNEFFDGEKLTFIDDKICSPEEWNISHFLNKK